MGNERPNTDDRVVDVLGELVAQFGSNFIVALASVAVRGREAFEIRDRFEVPNDGVGAHSYILNERTAKVYKVLDFCEI